LGTGCAPLLRSVQCLGQLESCIPSAGVKAGNVTSAGWQVTLCDPIRHLSSRSLGHGLRTSTAVTAVPRSCIPPRSPNRLPASAGIKAENVTSAGWQVTLCDPIRHLSSRSLGHGLRTSTAVSAVPRSTRVLHPFGWSKGGDVTSAGWQVTLCDPIRRVSSRRGEASCKLLYTWRRVSFVVPAPVCADAGYCYRRRGGVVGATSHDDHRAGHPRRQQRVTVASHSSTSSCRSWDLVAKVYRCEG